MGKYIAESLVKRLIANDIAVKNAKVAILGFTFKENCPDTRNTKVIDIYNELKEYGITPVVVDPQADADEAKRLYSIEFDSMDAVKGMDAVIMAVAHEDFKDYKPADIAKFFNSALKTKILLDIKGLFDMDDFAAPEFDYWRL
jgi:UDP-N-acetyl-D-galactosamine dehydrogenase